MGCPVLFSVQNKDQLEDIEYYKQNALANIITYPCDQTISAMIDYNLSSQDKFIEQSQRLVDINICDEKKNN